MTDPTANILASFSSAIAALAAKATPSIVSVHSRRSRATGFVFKPGFVITADETLADEGEVQVRLADGTSRTATVAGRDHTTDIALLRVDTAGLAPIKLSAGIPTLLLGLALLWVMVMFWIGDFSSHAKVGSAKSPGTPKQCRTPRRCRYSKRNCPIGIRAGNGDTAESAESGCAALPLSWGAGIRGFSRRCDARRLRLIRSLEESPRFSLAFDIIGNWRSVPIGTTNLGRAKKKRVRQSEPSDEYKYPTAKLRCP